MNASRALLALATLSIFLGVTAASAFPPAPIYPLLGLVGDQTWSRLPFSTTPRKQETATATATIAITINNKSSTTEEL